MVGTWFGVKLEGGQGSYHPGPSWALEGVWFWKPPRADLLGVLRSDQTCMCV